jgi:exopolysaccharide biosynthesis polyprenyl glycosylphosphotransferase
MAIEPTGRPVDSASPVPRVRAEYLPRVRDEHLRLLPVDASVGQRKPALHHRFLLQLVDLAMITTSAVLGAALIVWLSPYRTSTPDRAPGLSVADVVVVAVAIAIAMHLHGLYRRPTARLRPSDWWGPLIVARCLPTAVLVALAMEAFASYGARELTLSAAVAMTLPAVAFVPFGRYMVNQAFGSWVTRILVVGSGELSVRLISRLRRCPDTFVVGRVDDFPEPGVAVLGSISELSQICAQHQVERIILASPMADEAVLLEALRLVQGTVPISEIPQFFELHNWRSESEELQGLTLFHLPPSSMSRSARVAKRLMDFTLASCALVCAAPLMLAIAVAIKIDSPGPVFFRQERIGRHGRPFRIFKFRSMTADAWHMRNSVAGFNQVDGPLFKMDCDPRVTKVGEFIRKTSLDELPQLINVVRGEMSLVGPRPLPTEESNLLDGAALNRFDVKPGITGLWQVCGRSDLSYADLQHLDSAYVKSWSLMWDFRILLQTPKVVFRRSGAY